MAPIADATVDWSALLEVVYTSLAAGIGVTAAFAVALLGATRAVDVRQDGHGVAAAGYAALTLIAFAVVVAAIVTGIVVMTQK
jgi:hypothetical protein